MANTVLTHDMLAERALVDLVNNLQVAKHVFKGYNPEFQPVGRFQKGDSVRIALPNRFRTQAGPTYSQVELNEQNTSVTVDVHRLVPIGPILETEWTQDIEGFSLKYINPAMIALADYVEQKGCQEGAENFYNVVGTAGVTPSTFAVIAQAKERMANEAVPRSPRVAVISPAAERALMDGELKAVFVPSMVEGLLREGFIGKYAGFEFYSGDQVIHSITAGTRAGTPQVNATAAENATSLVIKGLGGSETVKKGEVFTVAGVVGVNPVNGIAWEGDQLRQFVVTADATESGTTTVNISPTIRSSGAATKDLPYQTVVDLPATNDVITWVGTLSTAYPQNLFFHPDAMALTVVPFAKPMSAGQSVMWGQASDKELGLSITVSTQFDNPNYQETTRFDILFGWDTVRPELGVRLTG